MNTPAPSIAQRVEEAEALHLQGRLAEAERLYEAVLDDDPTNFDALHRIGVIRAKQGRHEDAVESLRAALERNPESAVAHYNLGIALAALMRRDDATASYQRAIAIRPDFAQAHVNLGNLLDTDEAAIACYQRALEIKPDLAAAHRNLGDALLRSGQPVGAAEAFRRWLEIEPDSQIAAYLHAMASGKGAVPRAPDAWVERFFDGSAATFDARLRRLGYRAPEHVAGALRRAGGPPRALLSVLDAGCGTGLAGPLLRPHARQLTGVDLSSGMLERAKATGAYDQLDRAELVDYMRGVRGTFDAIVSCDTLVYFGALEPVLQAAHGALRTGGLLVFTVEEALERDARSGYRLQAHGRYSHSLTYLRRVTREAGFGVLAIESATLRMERGKPVPGLVATCERLARAGMQAPLAMRLRAIRMSVRRIAGWIRRRVNPGRR